MNAGLRVGRHDGWLVAVLAAYLVSRLLAHHYGVRIDLLDGYQWQLLDPALLESRFLESLWNCHSQPPVFNALHGMVLKLASSSGVRTLIWTGLQSVLGIVIAGSLYGTLLTVGVSRVVAAILSAGFVCSPAALVYERSLSYTYFDTALVSAAAYALARYCYGKRPRALGWFLGLCVTMSLTRAAYHLVWLIGLLLIILAYGGSSPARRKHIALAGAVAVAIVGAFYLKNQCLFGTLGPSSWAGMNLATMTHTNLDGQSRGALRDSGRVSALTEQLPFLALDQYPEEFRRVRQRGIPVLDRELRFDGSPNFNHAAYIGISKQYARDALVVGAAKPSVYLKSVVRNLLSFVARSSTDYRFVTKNLAHIERWNAVYSAFVYGQFGAVPRIWASTNSPANEPELLKYLSLTEVVARKAGESCLFLACGILLLPLLGLRLAYRSQDSQHKTFIYPIVATIVYVMATTALLNSGESHRMRFEVEPLLTILLGITLAQVLRVWRSKKTA